MNARLVSLQDSASRLGEVMAEQTARLQELRQQLSSDRGWRAATEEVQALQEELRLALRRDKENQELSRSQATMLDSLTRTLHMKDELIRVRGRGYPRRFQLKSDPMSNRKISLCVCRTSRGRWWSRQISHWWSS